MFADVVLFKFVQSFDLLFGLVNLSFCTSDYNYMAHRHRLHFRRRLGFFLQSLLVFWLSLHDFFEFWRRLVEAEDLTDPLVWMRYVFLNPG